MGPVGAYLRWARLEGGAAGTGSATEATSLSGEACADPALGAGCGRLSPHKPPPGSPLGVRRSSSGTSTVTDRSGVATRERVIRCTSFRALLKLEKHNRSSNARSTKPSAPMTSHRAKPVLSTADASRSRGDSGRKIRKPNSATATTATATNTDMGTDLTMARAVCQCEGRRDRQTRERWASPVSTLRSRSSRLKRRSSSRRIERKPETYQATAPQNKNSSK